MDDLGRFVRNEEGFLNSYRIFTRAISSLESSDGNIGNRKGALLILQTSYLMMIMIFISNDDVKYKLGHT